MGGDVRSEAAGGSSGDPDQDVEFLAALVDSGCYNFDEGHLETCLANFREAAHAHALGHNFGHGYGHGHGHGHPGAGAAVRPDDLRLPLSKCLGLLEMCGLSHFAARFTPDGVTEALYKFSSAQDPGSGSAPDASAAARGQPSAPSWEGSLWALFGRAPSRPTQQDLTPFKKGPHSLLSFEDFVQVLAIARAEELEPDKTPNFPFDPESGPKQAWDFLIMAFLMYTTFSVPYMLSFGDNTDRGGDSDSITMWTFWDVFDVFLDVIFCIDIVVNFCTAYVSRGVYVTSMKRIALYYLKTWFFVDFFGSVPFDKIVMLLSSGAGSNEEIQERLRPLRLVRILKMARAVRFLQKLSQLEQKDTTGTLKTVVSVFRAIFVMVFVAHALACVFYMIIDKTSEDNWMATADPDMLDFDKTSNGVRYVLSF